MLQKTIKELSKHTVIYSLAYVASSFASVFLLPIYTRFLSKADYGILELLDYTNIVLIIIVMAGLNAAIPKFFNDADSIEEKNNVISTGLLFVITAGGILSLLAFSQNDVLARLILGDSSYTYFINLNIVLLYVQLIAQIGGIGFIAAKKSKIYLNYMLAKLFLAITMNIYFIVFLKLGVLGMLYGNLTANGLIAFVVIIHSFKINGTKLSFPHLNKLLRFGFPLIPASLAGTIMHNADRFLIRHYCSFDDVGLYAIGYKFPFMLNALILQSFSFIWSSATMYEVSKQPDSAYQYGRITTYVIGFFLFTQLCLSIFSVPIVRILTDQKFFAAHQVIPLVALGLSFHAFYFFFSVGTFLKKKTWLVNIAYFPAAVTNIVGNVILLPKYGYMAAAYMTIVTYFIFATILYFSCRKLIRVEYEFKRLAILFVTSVAVFKISNYIVFDSLFLEIIKGIGFVTLFIVLLSFGGWLTKGERDFCKEKFQDLRGYFAH